MKKNGEHPLIIQATLSPIGITENFPFTVSLTPFIPTPVIKPDTKYYYIIGQEQPIYINLDYSKELAVGQKVMLSLVEDY